MDFDTRILAARLKRLRTQLNMTQEQLAELVDLSAIYIRYMESGNRVPSLENMIRICNVLGCTMDELLDGFLTAKPSNSPTSVDRLLKGCSYEERIFLMKTCIAFKEFLDETI